MAEFLELDRIRLDGGTQPRSAIFDETVSAYVEDMNRGDAFPPVTVFFDGESYWLADGFHRYAAAKERGAGGIRSEVRQGTQRDAVLFSVGANADHGRSRTNEDKRRAVLRLLNDPEWAIWSDREIARHCRVGHPLVASLRPKEADTGISSSMDRTFVHPKTGQPSVMRTENIGRRTEQDHPVFDATLAGRDVPARAQPTAEQVHSAPPAQPRTAEDFDPKADTNHLNVMKNVLRAVKHIWDAQPDLTFADVCAAWAQEHRGPGA